MVCLGRGNFDGLSFLSSEWFLENRHHLDFKVCDVTLALRMEESQMLGKCIRVTPLLHL